MKQINVLGTGKRRFSRQLFLSIFFASFLILTIVLLMFFLISMQSTISLNNNVRQETIEIVGNNLQNALNRVDETARDVFFQQNMLESVSENFKSNGKAFSTINHALISANASNSSVCFMGLYDSLGGTVRCGATSKMEYSNYEELINYFATCEVYAKQGGMFWYFLQTNPSRSSDYCIMNLRHITLPVANVEKEIAMVIGVSERALCDVYEYLGPGSFLMTADGTIISAVDKELIGTSADGDFLWDVTEASGHGASLVRHDGKTYHAVYLSELSSYFVTESNADVLSKSAMFAVVASGLLLFLGVLFSYLFSKYLSRKLSYPLTELKKTMEQARNGDLQVRSNLNRYDEIGYLGESFNHMMDSLNAKIREVTEQQNRIKDSDIRLLQAQINPHLLYNTLDSALFLIEQNDMNSAAQILTELSNFFKLSLQAGNRIVPISKELAHITSYLNLQNLCRGKNFSLEVLGEEQLLSYPILQMLLQPVVENAVLHGFEGNDPDGTITIAIRQNKNTLYIRIEDDGLGMDEETLQKVRSQLEQRDNDNGSYALWNIVQRIRMNYGSEYGIRIESEFGEYTAVTLTLPYDEKTGETEHVSFDDC